MLKKILLFTMLINASESVMADHYTYIAGGWQFGHIGDRRDFDQLLNRRGYENTGSQSMSSGFYLRGGYGFENNLFIDARMNGMTNGDRTTADSVLGLGYHHALSDKVDLYALFGRSGHAIRGGYAVRNDFSVHREEKDWQSITGELGLKIRPIENIDLHSAWRLANYAGQAFYELRLGISHALTQNLAVDAGYIWHDWKVDDQAGQFGLRYIF